MILPMRLQFSILILFLLFDLTSPAQLILDRQAMVSGVVLNDFSGGSLESSLGQVVTGVYMDGNGAITQGFHQPPLGPTLLVELAVKVNDCDKTYEVQITSISGCDPNANRTVEWNNAPGAILTKGLPSFATLRITTDDGCFFMRSYDLASFNPTTLPCDLRPFNYLTPNGDGSNDFFYIENIDRPNYKGARVSVFNRWGQLIWEGKNYDNAQVKWTGNNADGNAVPAGTYFYTIDVIGTKLTGYVELMQ
jgi:gliding motility-associated-like protein